MPGGEPREHTNWPVRSNADVAHAVAVDLSAANHTAVGPSPATLRHWDDLPATGRHFRVDAHTKLVDAEDNSGGHVFAVVSVDHPEAKRQHRLRGLIARL